MDGDGLGGWRARGVAGQEIREREKARTQVRSFLRLRRYFGHAAVVAEVAFKEDIAATYDADSAEMFDDSALRPAADFLAAVAAGGGALEFRIGTGRVPPPRADRGRRGLLPSVLQW